MAELPELGDHCSVPECNQLDFLPILCDRCKKLFCKIHSTYFNHSCEADAKDLAKFTGVKSYKCDLKDCKKTELTLIICQPCGKNFCLQHRHQVDHSCSAYEPPKESMTQTKDLVKNILDRTEAKNVDNQKPRKTRNKSKATAAKVALMKIKMNASGNKGIPETERVYIKFVLPLGSKEQTKNVFFSNKWTIGKTVDYVADICKLTNDNNVGHAKKLKLFELEEGLVVDFSRSVEDSMKNGLFYSGSSLALEYVDTNTVSLVDVQSYLSSI